jgi:hypothetical protein
MEHEQRIRNHTRLLYDANEIRNDSSMWQYPSEYDSTDSMYAKCGKYGSYLPNRTSNYDASNGMYE